MNTEQFKKTIKIINIDELGQVRSFFGTCKAGDFKNERKDKIQ